MEGKKRQVKSESGRKPAASAKSGTKLAVMELGGKQHLVREGSELSVNHLDLKEGKSAKAEAVILEPVLGKGSVTYKVLREERGPKVLIMKYKAKSRYRRKRGYRSDLTRVLVEKIEV